MRSKRAIDEPRRWCWWARSGLHRNVPLSIAHEHQEAFCSGVDPLGCEAARAARNSAARMNRLETSLHAGLQNALLPLLPLLHALAPKADQRLSLASGARSRENQPKAADSPNIFVSPLTWHLPRNGSDGCSVFGAANELGSESSHSHCLRNSRATALRLHPNEHPQMWRVRRA
jgi:hypothetical protein